MEKLTAYLKNRQLKQKDFAAAVGVSPGAISQWLAAGQIPLERIGRVHEITGIPVQELAPRLFGEKSPVRAVRNRSQSKPRRLREPANA